MIETKKLVNILLDFGGEKIINYCEDELSRGKSPYNIFTDLSVGLEEIGDKFESGRYFTSDLIVSGSNMKKAVDYLRPLFMEARARALVG